MDDNYIRKWKHYKRRCYNCGHTTFIPRGRHHECLNCGNKQLQ